MQDFAQIVTEASNGLAALNRFIETRFALADEMEQDGDKQAADESRAVWSNVWSTLADAPTRAIHAEMQDLPQPAPLAAV